MIDLINLKNIFAVQLPKMPRDYIVRLVLNRKHRSLCLVRKSDDRVVGGICYRPFKTQGFCEVVFCAITESEQVKGYGRATMNELKEQVKIDATELEYPVPTRYFLTYADNHATTFFRKQGFSDKISQPRTNYLGFIKDYDGGTLMECCINPLLNYRRVNQIVSAQKNTVYKKVKTLSKSHVRHEGLKNLTLPDGKKQSVEIGKIPGVLEAGWKPSLHAYPTRGPSNVVDASNMTPLSDLQAKLGAVWKAVRNLKDSWPFHKPVDRAVVPDYYKIISEPMDLTTMNKRLGQGYYRDKEMFIYDFFLIVNNCKGYNSPNTVYYRSAQIIQENFITLMHTFGMPVNQQN
jgi:histone acetyltransferase